MSDFVLDSRLQSDCHKLGRIGDSLLLLMDNSLVPWLILVPMVDETEFHELEWDTQLQLLDQINLLSGYLKLEFPVDKLNVAAIGNIVRQMHIHIVGRSEQDFCWPNVVWGAGERQTYDRHQVAVITDSLCTRLGDMFIPSPRD
jgi:diadenosine tetraphosphate (Ap4A) HIT family hydrolase